MSDTYQPPDDPNALLYLCRCAFDPAYDDDGEGSWHFKRTCLHCGTTWAGLHCPHDGHQNPCPGCGRRPDTLPTYLTAGQINAIIAAARALIEAGGVVVNNLRGTPATATCSATLFNELIDALAALDAHTGQEQPK